MRYSGSKGGCGSIAKIIQTLLPVNGSYFEPFCGACKIIEKVRCGRRYASDIDRPIVNLLKAIQDDWIPPHNVTEEDHAFWSLNRESDSPMVALVGYGCSFGGKFARRFIRPEVNHGSNPCQEARNTLLRQKPKLEGVEMRVWDYRDGLWMREVPSVVYCDPPYRDTTQCGSSHSRFSSDEFWEWCAKLSKKTTVLVSEYQCPIDRAVVLWQKQKVVCQGNNHKRSTKQKIEKLFCLDPAVVERVGLGLTF